MSSPIAGVAVVNAIVFGVYGQAQRYSTNPDNLSTHFIAGAFAGLAQTPVVTPLELIKTRLQINTLNKKNNKITTTTINKIGPINCLREIYRNNGITGIFNGCSVTALRETPSYGLYFFTYEALTRTNNTTPITTLHMLLAGGLAGTVSWIFTYPIDVIKSRLQADCTGRYSGAVDCLQQSLRDEGYRCLFRGLNSTIIRAFPTNAATFVVVHWTFRMFGEEQNSKKKKCNFDTNSTFHETQQYIITK